MKPNAYDANRFSAQDPRTIKWEKSDEMIRVSQIIVIALCSGIIMYAVTTFILGATPKLLSNSMVWVGIALAAISIFISSIVPALFASPAASDSALGERIYESEEEAKQAETLFGTFLKQLIARCAILEGAGFFNLVMFQLYESFYSLLAGALMAVLIAIRFPTKGRVQAWMADRLR